MTTPLFNPWSGRFKRRRDFDTGTFRAALGGGQVTSAGQFTPETYGGIGDGKIVSDGAMSSSVSPHNLTCATSTPFTAGDAGKTVWVFGAGSAGADLITTIASFVSSSTVTLTAACATTVASHGVAWGTDNGPAILSAHNAAWSYAQANSPNKAQVVFDNKVYVVGAATPWVTGATLEGNALFPFPLVSQSGKLKACVDYIGLGGDVCALPIAQQTEPQFTGSTVLVLREDGVADITYGPPSVFGGPVNGFGGEPGTYNNTSITVDNVCIAGPFNPTFGGWDFFGSAQAFVPNGSFMPLGIVPAAGAWPQLASGSITNTGTASGQGIGIWGLRMPCAGNNDRCDVGWWSGYGICYGFGPSEHTTWLSTRTNYCIIGIQPYAGNGTSMVDGILGQYSSVEACSQGVGGLDGGIKIVINRLDIESLTNIIFDPNNHVTGEIHVGGQLLAGYTSSGVYSSGTGLGIKITALNNTGGPVSSPQAPPSSTAAWVNGYYRDAYISLHMSAGSVSAISIDAVAQSATTITNLAFLLPAGHSYTPTYAGGTLSHTVTLI